MYPSFPFHPVYKVYWVQRPTLKGLRFSACWNQNKLSWIIEHFFFCSCVQSCFVAFFFLFMRSVMFRWTLTNGDQKKKKTKDFPLDLDTCLDPRFLIGWCGLTVQQVAGCPYFLSPLTHTCPESSTVKVWLQFRTDQLKTAIIAPFSRLRHNTAMHKVCSLIVLGICLQKVSKNLYFSVSLLTVRLL